VRGHEIDFRVSAIPSLHGEKVVLRVLDRTAVEFDYQKLGLPADIRHGIERALELTRARRSGPDRSDYHQVLVATILVRLAASRPATAAQRWLNALVGALMTAFDLCLLAEAVRSR
jgi:hypothetical protein